MLDAGCLMLVIISMNIALCSQRSVVRIEYCNMIRLCLFKARVECNIHFFIPPVLFSRFSRGSRLEICFCFYLSELRALVVRINTTHIEQILQLPINDICREQPH